MTLVAAGAQAMAAPGPATMADNSSPAPMVADVDVLAAPSGAARSFPPDVAVGSGIFISPSPSQPAREANIPFWRRMLGDAAVAKISAPDEWTDADRAHASRLFPEAELVAPIQLWINGTLNLTAGVSTTQDDSDGDLPAPEEAAHGPNGSDAPPTP
jgi:hypothetical protein